MKTLTEIKRNIISIYSRIQTKVTDFGVGSVAHDIIFSVSAALESIHRRLSEIERQAYVATASGEYLDKLIDGTFQFKRGAATRSVGYVVFYGDSPLSNPGSVKLRYADFDYSTGEFTGGLQAATKVIGRNAQGDDGIVYALISPRNRSALEETSRLINLNGRRVQYLILPVASVITGRKSNIVEGGITTFPSPTPGINKVVNTSNPGTVFFSSGEDVSSAPFYARFTEALSYDDGVLRVVNAFNFSPVGFVEVRGDIYNRDSVSAVYSNHPIGTSDAVTRTAGLIFEYIDRDTSTLTLNNGIQLPELVVPVDGGVETLTLRQFSHTVNNVTTTYQDDDPEVLTDMVESFITGTFGLIVHQRLDQVSPEVIFDPDSVLASNYRISDTDMVVGGVDQDDDEVYREALIKYLSSLSRATPSALEAGALQVPGITFARTLGSRYTPRGSTAVLVSNEDGVVSETIRNEVSLVLDELWKAAGINVIVMSPELVRTHVSMVIRPISSTSNVVTHRQVSSTVANYLRSLDPGDSIKYSDLLAQLREIPSIENVFNLLILKSLSGSTYTDRKPEYDLELLRLIGSELVDVDEVPAGLSPGDAIKPDGLGGYEATTPDDPDAVGIVYYTAPSSYGIIIATSAAGSVASLYSAYDDLLEVETPDGFEDTARTYRSYYAPDDYQYAYIASYLFSEPMDEVPGIVYPVNPTTVQYQFVTDYEALEVQVFRLDNLFLTPESSLPYVGIRFI